MCVQDLKHRKVWGEPGKGPCLRNVVILASKVRFLCRQHGKRLQKQVLQDT